MAYNPSFNQPAIGKFNRDTSFISVKSGSDAYLLENEVNEMQWTRIYEEAQKTTRLLGNGVINTSGRKANNMIQVVSTNRIRILPTYLLVFGHYYYIPQTEINLSGDNSGTNYLYIDFAFKEIKATDSVIKNGNMNTNVTIPNTMVDDRINVVTSYRVQKQFYINTIDSISDDDDFYKDIPSYFFSTKYTDIDEEYNLMYMTTPAGYVPMSPGGMTYGLVIASYSGNVSSINDLNIMVKDVTIGGNTEILQQEINSLNIAIANLQQQISTLDVQSSYYDKYGLYMNMPAYIYNGDSYVSPVLATVAGYSLSNDNDYVFQLTNVGNNYAGQIGEVWCQLNGSLTAPDATVLKVYNSGAENIMFMLSHFRKNDNEEIAYNTISSAGNGSYKTIRYDNGFKVKETITDISGWNMDNCIVCVQPLYPSTQTFSTVPSIGDIWVNDNPNNSTLQVYNSGAANIPLQVFILNSSFNSKLQVVKTDFTTSSTLVNDAFGNHHTVQRNVVAGTKFVMVGTPSKTTNADTQPDIGEVYVMTGDDEYILNTTSNGTGARGVYIKCLVFNN